ncbi:hypothetical protein SAMN05421738_11723 [Algoriella xinjiangensis]|uniref:Uncharacterized protein n=1 Tax=Algoriella xinjiangensis TaxID=684065 RepID=A0A1I5AJA4_9FLAO|nr:hypothetical protein SAMN05421738_11723 [Algoriella xinjiangensis]VDH16265.1 Uncharacterised protein [Algoriella xinjiangensis]
MKNKLLFTLLFSSSLLFAQQKFIVEYAQNNQNNPEKE